MVSVIKILLQLKQKTQRQHPKRRVFEALHQRMGDTGRLQPTHHVGRSRNNVNAEEAILNIVEDHPNISTRRLW